MQPKQKEQKKKAIRGGRPPKAPQDRKTVQLKVWVTPADAAAIKKKAKAEGFKHAGTFMSKAIRDAVQGTTPTIKLNPVDMRNLQGIGSNINQIAKHLHSGGEYYQEMHEDVVYAGGLVKKLGIELYRLLKEAKGGAVK